MEAQAVAVVAEMNREFAVAMFFAIAALCFSVSFVGFWLAEKRVKVKDAVVVGLFFLGVLCLLWFFAWAGIGLIWVASDVDETPMCVLSMSPRWIFAFSFFSLLGARRTFLERTEKMLLAFCKLLEN